MEIEVYTDGSCNPKTGIGSWVAVILTDKKKSVIKGLFYNTTHNHMELMAVYQALEFISKHSGNPKSVQIYTDSQYVVGIPVRLNSLISKDFVNRNGDQIPNYQLIKSLQPFFENRNVRFIKVKAHGRKDRQNPYHREADILSRKLVRNKIRETDWYGKRYM